MPSAAVTMVLAATTPPAITGILTREASLPIIGIASAQPTTAKSSAMVAVTTVRHSFFSSAKPTLLPISTSRNCSPILVT